MLVVDEAVVFVLLVMRVEDVILLLELEELLEVVVATVELGLVVLAIVLEVDDVAATLPPTLIIAELSGANQSFAKTIFPASLGWTPSAVSTAGSYPVQQSTTLTGLAVVEILAAQAGTAASRSITPW